MSEFSKETEPILYSYSYIKEDLFRELANTITASEENHDRQLSASWSSMDARSVAQSKLEDLKTRKASDKSLCSRESKSLKIQEATD